jgi:hypothetical protein
MAMAAIRFDTLDYARKLERAGVPAEQAAVQAKALSEALASTDNLHDDIHGLNARFDQVDARFEQVDARFEHLEAKLGAKIDAVDLKLSGKIDAVDLKLSGKIGTLHWMFGVMVALNATVVIQLLFRH